MEQRVSDFISETCLVRPQPNGIRLAAAILRARLQSGHYHRDQRTHCAISSGSSSELYIEPMLPNSVGDIDTMWHYGDELAVPNEYAESVPHHLPAEFADEVEGFAVISHTRFPGYVYLLKRFKLIKNSTGDEYALINLQQNELSWALRINTKGAAECHRSIAVASFNPTYLDLDAVRCKRCLVWPPQATEWKQRHRAHCWPDAATLELVIGNGCDIVQATRPSCQKEEKQDKLQWRLSFSRAETVLLNTWSSKQQIVYHVLRFVLKPEIKKTDKVLSNYVIKTLMLWACEEHPQEWWNSLNTVRICAHLLRRLSDKLKSAKCEMYFITEMNLLGHIDGSHQLPDMETFLQTHSNSDELSKMLELKYVGHCIELYREDMELTGVKEMCHDEMLKSVIDWRHDRLKKSLPLNYNTFCIQIAAVLQTIPPQSRVYDDFFYDLKSVDLRLYDFSVAIAFLRLSTKLDEYMRLSTELDKEQFEWDTFARTLVVVVRNSTRRIRSWESTMGEYPSGSICRYNWTFFSALEAVRHARDTASLLIIAEVLKLCLAQLARCSCAVCVISDESRPIFHLVDMYLACLYFGCADNRTAIEHCVKAVNYLSSPGNCELFVKRSFLPQFDEQVDNVFGLIDLYEYLVDRYRLSRVPRASRRDYLNARLLGMYLILSPERRPVNKLVKIKITQFSIQQQQHSSHHRRSLASVCSDKANLTDVLLHRCRDRLHVADVLLMYLLYIRLIQFKSELQHSNSSIVEQGNGMSMKRSSGFVPEELRRLLVLDAVDRLTLVQATTSRDFRSVRKIVATDFKAMHALKCGSYDECLELSEKNVVELLDDDDEIGGILVSPSPLLSLADDQCVSVFGSATLVSFIDEPIKQGTDATEVEALYQLTMSIYLALQSKLMERETRASLIKSLRQVITVHRRYRRYGSDAVFNNALLSYVYRKGILYVKRQSTS